MPQKLHLLVDADDGGQAPASGAALVVATGQQQRRHLLHQLLQHNAEKQSAMQMRKKSLS